MSQIELSAVVHCTTSTQEKKRECKSRAGKWQSCVGRAAQIARLVGIHGKYKVLHSKYKQQSTKYKAQNEKQIRSKVTAMICTSYKVQNTT